MDMRPATRWEIVLSWLGGFWCFFAHDGVELDIDPADDHPARAIFWASAHCQCCGRPIKEWKWLQPY